jgi:hypothetical protein
MVDNSLSGFDVGGSLYGQDVHQSNGLANFGSGFDGHDLL